jgi:hypothetical protein
MARSPIKKVPILKEILEVKEHICLHGTKVNDMHKILTGNGNPEEGLINRLAIIKERQGKVIDTLIKVDESLKSLDRKSTDLLIEITRITGKEAGEKETEAKRMADELLKATNKRDKNWRIATFISITVAVLGLGLGLYKLIEGQKHIKTDTTIIKSDMEDVNGLSRGLKYSPFLQMIQDSVKRDSINKLK